MWSRTVLLIFGIFACLFGLGVMFMPLVMVDLFGTEAGLQQPLTIAYVCIAASLVLYYFALSESKSALFVACAAIYMAVSGSLLSLLWRGSRSLESRMTLRDEAYLYGGMLVLGAFFILWLVRISYKEQRAA